MSVVRGSARSGSIHHTLSTAGVSGEIPYFTGTHTLDHSSDLVWDSTNGRLGIGTAAPQEALDVRGSVRIGDSNSLGWDDTNGRLGVGTLTPLDTLDVRGSARIGDSNNLAWDDTNGRLGVGTLTPQDELEVVGSVRAGDSNLFYWDDTNGRLGIGTASPDFDFSIVSESSQAVIGMKGPAAPAVLGQRCNGSFSSPTATTSGQWLSSFEGGGYDGSAWTNSQADIALVANENFSNTNQGTRIIFRTTPDGSTTPAEAMRIRDNGFVAIGTTSPATDAILDLSTTAGAFLPPRLTTAERNAITAVAGMIIYNTTTSKHQGYDGAAWNDFY